MAAVDRSRVGHWRRSVVNPARGLVTEIAAGTALNFRHYSRGATVIATDTDVAMPWRARARATQSAVTVYLVAADAEALPFRTSVFDATARGRERRGDHRPRAGCSRRIVGYRLTRFACRPDCQPPESLVE